MRKSVFLAAAGALVLGALTVTSVPTSVEARPSCGDIADARYPYDRWARKSFKQACKDRRSFRKANRKAFKKARKRRGIWIGY